MWKQLLDFGNKLFALMRRTQKLEEENTALQQELKEVRQDIKELNQKVDQLSDLVQRLVFEFQRDRENAGRDREIQRLQLENILLRFERGLPPKSKSENEDNP
jgi:predicted RNase H-like nuclease (RuvC/YqgF family)